MVDKAICTILPMPNDAHIIFFHDQTISYSSIHIINFAYLSIFFNFRCNFYAYCIFSLFNTVVYCFPAGWIWSENGFLKTMGCVDIAGSGGVHLVGGASGIPL